MYPDYPLSYCTPALLQRDTLQADQPVIVKDERGLVLATRASKGCVDEIPTCHHFDEDYDGCNPKSEYHEYLQPNCKATCGLCKYDDGEYIALLSELSTSSKSLRSSLILFKLPNLFTNFN